MGLATSAVRLLAVFAALLASLGCRQILGLDDTRLGCVGSACSDGGTSGECEQSSECPAMTSPICDTEEQVCRVCTSGDECVARDPMLPACVDGGCLECDDNDDCASGACNIAANECIPEEDVVFADAVSGTDSSGCGTQAQPCQTINAALAEVTETRRYVRALAGGTFTEASGTIDVDGVTVELLADGATFDFDNGTAIFTVNGGGNLTITGGTIVGDPGLVTAIYCPMAGATIRLVGATVTGAGGSGISCPGTIDIEDSLVEANGEIGIDGSNSVNLRVARSIVRSNGDHAIIGGQSNVIEENEISGNVGIGFTVTGGTSTISRNEFRSNANAGIFVQDGDATIRNNFVILNGADANGALGGIDLLSNVAMTVLVEFNTIAENTRDAPDPEGLLCQNIGGTADFTARNNLIVFNGDSGNTVSDCNHSYSNILNFTNGDMINNQSPQVVSMNDHDWHLTASSPCVGLSSNGSTVDIDFDGDARPQGGSHDCGADEFVP